MNQREHIECEIKEIQIEIEYHKKAIKNLTKVLERTKEKLMGLKKNDMYLLHY